MAHFALIRSPATNWIGGTVITPGELTSFNTNLSQAVNGDGGGCWAPSAPIIIGGHCMQVNAPLLVTRGGTLTSGVAGAFICGDSDFPVLDVGHTGRTRRVMVPCMIGRPAVRRLWRVRREDAGLQAYAPMFDLRDSLGMVPARAYVPIRPHDGATLNQVTVYFRVGFPHPQTPTLMPKARIIRVDPDGGVLPMSSTATGADADGYLSVTKPGTSAAWYAGGAMQSLVLPCDQNNALSKSAFTYFAELVDEQGLTGYPWQLDVHPTCKLSTVANIATSGGIGSSFDGVTVASGDRILVRAQSNPLQNGIYLVSSGTWARALDLQGPGDFAQGMIVSVDQGTINGGSTWQVTPSITAWPFDNTGVPTVALTFITRPTYVPATEGTAFLQHGTIWQQLLVEFTNIADARWA